MFGHDKENKKQEKQVIDVTAAESMGNAENAYQTGYYRSVPHQDEPIYSNPYQNQTQSNNGSCSYANYYSNPADQSGKNGKEAKKKKKHTGLKVVACVAAVALVSVGSIQAYRYITPFFTKESSSSLYQASAKKESGASEDAVAATTENKSDSKSWIELASGGEVKSVTEIVSKVMPSVVGVQSTFTYTGNGNLDNSYGFGFGYGFGYGNNSGSEQTMTATGTGIIMTDDGYIVTNSHVIYDDEYGCGEATKVEIVMEDQETYHEATIIAYDQETDLAVLKTDLTGLPAAEFGDSDTLQVGELVVAIGNPLGFELFDTVTCGIVSALNRQVTINDKSMTLIQTDTAINSGNSGGPLINSAGQVIGINSAKMSSSYSSGGASVEGIGFAIPITEAREIINDLLNHGYVTGRPQLGITCQDVSESVSQAYNMPIGVYIISVSEGGAADKAGLKTGDVIVGIEGQEITTSEELNNVKNEYNAGDTVTLTIVREGKSMNVDIELEEVTSAS